MVDWRQGKKTLSTSGSVKAQGARYLVVGCASACIELIIFSLLFYVFGIPVGYSSPISLIMSTIFNFFLSSTWSFKGSTNIKRSAVLYFLLFALNTAFSSAFSGWLFGQGLPGIIAKLITMVCIVLWNFVLYRKVIFH